MNKTFSGLSLGGGNIAKTSVDALKALYGTNDGMVLFWAHHEKLCLIDERLVFMGGLDMCKLCGPASNITKNRQGGVLTTWVP